MKKIWRTFCMVCLILIVLCSFPLMTSAESSDIAEGIVHTSRGEVTWAIDKTGKLILTGIGEVSLQDGEKRVPWYEYRDQIFSAEIKTTNMKDASYLLAGCKRLRKVDLTEWDTAGMENAQSMFLGCENLESVDLSGKDFSNVQNMNGMFEGCIKVPNIDFSNVTTDSATDMGKLFCRCESLKILAIESFDIADVTNMSNMFDHCYQLEE